MKSIISCVILLQLSAILLISNRSFANDAPPLIAQNNTKIDEFNIVGTEPFWNVTVSKSGIVYSSPNAKKQTFPYVTPIKAAGRTADIVRVYRLQGKPNSMLIIKKESTCSDGMSDKQYPYSVTLILNNTVLEGCAEKK
ncbi:MAG: hypothetical protein KME22_04010 [Hassallia sp. WJT32-NPBG1]|jgi:uncharacterized membrane protein|nr:hypothetical protein [Hassallia sp. WJT32-NPBG1]